MKTNRNLLSRTEVNTLLKCIEEGPSNQKAFQNAAELLGRSAGACSVKFYKLADKRKSFRKEALVLNPVTQKMQVSVKVENDNIIIRKTHKGVEVTVTV